MIPDDLLVKFLEQSPVAGILLWALYIWRRDMIESRKKREDMFTEIKNESTLNREAHIESVRTTQNLISVIENNTKVSEKVLEKVEK